MTDRRYKFTKQDVMLHEDANRIKKKLNEYKKWRKYQTNCNIKKLGCENAPYTRRVLNESRNRYLSAANVRNVKHNMYHFNTWDKEAKNKFVKIFNKHHGNGVAQVIFNKIKNAHKAGNEKEMRLQMNTLYGSAKQIPLGKRKTVQDLLYHEFGGGGLQTWRWFGGVGAEKKNESRIETLLIAEKQLGKEK